MSRAALCVRGRNISGTRAPFCSGPAAISQVVWDSSVVTVLQMWLLRGPFALSRPWRSRSHARCKQSNRIARHTHHSGAAIGTKTGPGFSKWSTRVATSSRVIGMLGGGCWRQVVATTAPVHVGYHYCTCTRLTTLHHLQTPSACSYPLLWHSAARVALPPRSEWAPQSKHTIPSPTACSRSGFSSVRRHPKCTALSGRSLKWRRNAGHQFEVDATHISHKCWHQVRALLGGGH